MKWLFKFVDIEVNLHCTKKLKAFSFITKEIIHSQKNPL